MIRQRLRPHRIHFKHGRLNRGSFHRCPFLEHGGTCAERHEECKKSRPNIEITLHSSPPSFPACKLSFAAKTFGRSTLGESRREGLSCGNCRGQRFRTSHSRPARNTSTISQRNALARRAGWSAGHWNRN